MHNCRLLCNWIYPLLWIISLSVESLDKKRSPLHMNKAKLHFHIAAGSINICIHMGAWLAWFHTCTVVPGWGNDVGFIDVVEDIPKLCESMLPCYQHFVHRSENVHIHCCSNSCIVILDGTDKWPILSFRYKDLLQLFCKTSTMVAKVYLILYTWTSLKEVSSDRLTWIYLLMNTFGARPGHLFSM